MAFKGDGERNRGAGRDDSNAGAMGGGKDSGSGGGGKGSSKEDVALANQLDKVKGLSGSNIGGFPGLGSQGNRPTAFGKPSVPTAFTPNYPFASPSIALGALADVLSSASPLGFAGMMGNVGKQIYSGGPMSTGFGMDIAKQLGGEVGPRVGSRGVGHDFSRDNQGNISAGYQLPEGYMMNTQPPGGTPSAPGTPGAPGGTPQGMGTVNQPGQYLSPTPGYGVWAPQYSYFGTPTQTPRAVQAPDMLNPYNPLKGRTPR